MDSVVTFVYFVHIAFVCSTEGIVTPCYPSLLSCCRDVDAKYELLHGGAESTAMSRALCNILFNNHTKSIAAVVSGNEPTIKLAKLSNSVTI